MATKKTKEMEKTCDTKVSCKNKITGIIMILVANILLSSAIAFAAVDYYVNAYPNRLIDSLQKYSENKNASETKEAVENLKKFSEEVSSNKNLPFIGNPQGTKIVVEFFDYNCGYCKHAFPEVMKLVANDAQVKVVLKELPILGPSSELASRAALAVHAKQPEKYAEFHKKLMQFKEQKTKESIAKIAAEVGVNFDILKELQNPEYQKTIDAHRALAQSLGISGTPSFVVNGALIPGAADATTIEKMLNAKPE